MKYKKQGIVALLVLILGWGGLSVVQNGTPLGSAFPQQSKVAKQYASTTAVTLTFGATARRVISTSTRQAAVGENPATAQRSAISFQTTNCATAGRVWLQFNDVAAATTTGFLVNSTSTATSVTGVDTLTLGQDAPLPWGSITALASDANCTLLITEWRTEN